MTDQTDPDALTAINGIGPAKARQMRDAGITTASALRAIGPDDAYRRMLRAGTQPHFIAYYALHMALQGRPWNDCKGDEKAALRRSFDAIKAEIPTGNSPAGMERILNAIGVGLQR